MIPQGAYAIGRVVDLDDVLSGIGDFRIESVVIVKAVGEADRTLRLQARVGDADDQQLEDRSTSNYGSSWT